MRIRKSTVEDLDSLLEIYNIARSFMEKSGNQRQWSKGYPGIELLNKDIEKGNSYICIYNKEAIGTFYFEIGEEPTYKKLYHGEWLNNKPYGIIHRIAVSKHNIGVASFCLNWCFKQIKNIKIDTHRDNIPMQKFILKNGFTYCGVILKPDRTQRLAYQKQ